MDYRGNSSYVVNLTISAMVDQFSYMSVASFVLFTVANLAYDTCSCLLVFQFLHINFNGSCFVYVFLSKLIIDSHR